MERGDKATGKEKYPTAKVKNLALFHHDPESTAGGPDAKTHSCVQRAARFGSRMTVFAAREGVELKF